MTIGLGECVDPVVVVVYRVRSLNRLYCIVTWQGCAFLYSVLSLVVWVFDVTFLPALTCEYHHSCEKGATAHQQRLTS